MAVMIDSTLIIDYNQEHFYKLKDFNLFIGKIS